MIADELRAANGHAVAPNLPRITLSSGYTVALRRQPADVMPKAQARAEAELQESKPTPPTQKLETAPGEFHEVEQRTDPDYLAALDLWQQQVNMKTTEKLLLILQRIALVYTIDQERLQELRGTYELLGIDLPSDDRAAWLGYVLAPTTDDQARLFEEVYGKGLPTEAQVALHRHLFPGDPQGQPA